MAARLALCAALILACQSSEQGSGSLPDHQIYVEATTPGVLSPEEGLSRCKQLKNERAMGDCGAVVVLNAAKKKHPNPESLCEGVVAGPWRAECYFEIAEFWRRKKNLKRAAALCAQTGPFRNDCSQHLWQDEVRQLVRKGLGRKRGEVLAAPDDKLWEEVLREGQRVYLRWDRLVGESEQVSTDFESRFWRRLFQNVFEPIARLNTLDCPTHDLEMQQRCRRAVAHLYLRRLQEWIRHPEAMEIFCGLSGDGYRTLLEGNSKAPNLSAEENPGLIEVLERANQHACVAKLPLPVNGDWLVKESAD